MIPNLKPAANCLCAVTVIGLATIVLPGCLLIGGSRTVKESPPAQSATLGQQLVDLGAARDMGVLTQSEFEAEKAKLLSPPRATTQGYTSNQHGCLLPPGTEAMPESKSVTAEITITPSGEKPGGN